MTVKIEREGWLQMFRQMRRPNGFLQSFFTIKPGGIYNGKKVAIDIQRFGEDVALVVKQGTGPRLNDADIFTTKEFEPPAYGEAVPFDVNDLLDRMAGTDPYTAAYQDYAGALLAYFMNGFGLIDDKIVRGVELQASQILQTGTLDLTDESGDTLYTLDFAPKATHFPTAGTAWDQAGSTKLADLESLAEVIRADGKLNPDLLIMGSAAMREFLKDEGVRNALDNRRMELGEIDPRMVDSGATLYGRIWIGAYAFQIWTYPDTYTDPQSGTPTKYVSDGNVIMLSSRTRLDRTSARVPLPLGPDPRVASLLPGRVSSREAGIDVTPNVYCTPNGKQIMGELESRTLLIPVQIDGFGTLDTGL